VDSWLFGPGGHFPLAPSVFVQVEAEKEGDNQLLPGDLSDVTDLFSCPACGGDRTFRLEQEALLVCQHCSKRYAKRDEIWDFKESLD
jgi:hypothetical protein